MKIAGIEISHPEKIYFPKSGITKQDVLEYYFSVSDKILDFLKDRPLTLRRFPEGVESKGFYQKQIPDYFPDFIKRVSIQTRDKTIEQVYCNDKKTLIYLVNQGTISFHPWLSKKDNLNIPDTVIFDLDPPGDDFERVKEAAQIIRKFLKDRNIRPKIMTTGKSGLHLYYSVSGKQNFDQIREKARDFSQILEEKHQELLTTALKKDKRGNKIFIDYLRNSYGQTSVCPYSLRSNENAGIAHPVSWNKLEDLKASDAYNLKDLLKK